MAEAFLDEMARMVPALRRYARALTRDADAADDLVQDCLERAIRKRALFRPVGPLRAWLFRILLNIHRNGRRGAARAGIPLELETLTIEPALPPPQLGRIALGEMARAIDALPAEQREALLLVCVEGLGYEEAASALGIPSGTLMSRLARARSTLRSTTGNGEEPRLRTVK